MSRFLPNILGDQVAFSIVRARSVVRIGGASPADKQCELIFDNWLAKRPTDIADLPAWIRDMPLFGYFPVGKPPEMYACLFVKPNKRAEYCESMQMATDEVITDDVVAAAKMARHRNLPIVDAQDDAIRFYLYGRYCACASNS